MQAGGVGWDVWDMYGKFFSAYNFFLCSLESKLFYSDNKVRL